VKTHAQFDMALQLDCSASGAVANNLLMYRNLKLQYPWRQLGYKRKVVIDPFHVERIIEKQLTLSEKVN
jgi:hypothetical protein